MLPLNLFELSNAQMKRVHNASIIAFYVSIVIAFAAVPLNRIEQPEHNRNHIFTFATFEIIFSLALLVPLVVILVQLLYQNQNGHDIPDLRTALFFLLLSGIGYTFPIKHIAVFVPDHSVKLRHAIFLARDIIVISATACLFFYLTNYPFRWIAYVTSHKEHPSTNSMFYLGGLYLLYASLQVIPIFLTRTHLETVPLHEIFSILSVFVRASPAISTNQKVFISSVVLIDVLIIAILVCNYLRSYEMARTSNDELVQELIIPLRHYRISAQFLLFNLAIIGISTIASSFHRKRMFENQFLFTTDTLGSTSIAIAIFTYIIRELVVHTDSQCSGFPSNMALGICEFLVPAEENSIDLETGSAFVYRISDDRNGESNEPIPKQHVFSLETAMLLFNVSWLSTTYGRKETPPLSPEQLHRPMLTVRAHLSNEQNTIHAILAENTDRFIIAFSPVSSQIAKQAALRPLPRSMLSQNAGDIDVLAERKLSSMHERMLRRGKVHHGIYKAYVSIQKAVHEQIGKLIEGQGVCKPIYITGLATGGALATLCSLDLSTRKLANDITVCMYNFGSTMVMNCALATVVNEIVPCRWRCVVAGDCNTIMPKRAHYKHISKVATFTRTGHLALERERSYKWWQSVVSSQPMHRKSSYSCAFKKWHKAYHVKGAIDLWDWPLEKSIVELFEHDFAITADTSKYAIDYSLQSPMGDIEAFSLRRIAFDAMPRSNSEVEDVVAFKK